MTATILDMNSIDVSSQVTDSIRLYSTNYPQSLLRQFLKARAIRCAYNYTLRPASGKFWIYYIQHWTTLSLKLRTDQVWNVFQPDSINFDVTRNQHKYSDKVRPDLKPVT